MTLWLCKEELIDLTGFRTCRKQKEALVHMHIKFRSRPDGFPLVERAQFDGSPHSRKRPEPRWDNR